MARRGKKSGGIFTKGFYVLVLLALIVLGTFWLLTRKSAPRPEAFSALERDPYTGMVLYEVPKSASLMALSMDLARKGLIPDAIVFRWFLRLTRQDKKIRAGFYHLKPSNSALEMASKLTAGKQATRLVTVPEGKTTWETYSILKTYYPLDSLVFDSLSHSESFITACQVEARSLEGYLFPDTYVMPWKLSEKDAIKIMVRRFHEVVRAMDLESPVIKNYGLGGWVTLASIVEEESAIPAEQELIAGVFYNRLLQGWTLGADPTVRYARRKLTGPLYVSDLEVNSPYNTRRFAGLPPGPICSPGRGALQASLNPVRTDKMFFVAKDDGTREHFFGIDTREHARYKAMAAENRRRRGEGLPDETRSQAPGNPQKKAKRKRGEKSF